MIMNVIGFNPECLLLKMSPIHTFIFPGQAVMEALSSWNFLVIILVLNIVLSHGLANDLQNGDHELPVHVEGSTGGWSCRQYILKGLGCGNLSPAHRRPKPAASTDLEVLPRLHQLNLAI